MENKNICELFLENYDKLKEYSYKICKKRELSQDITQDVYLSVHSKYRENDVDVRNKLSFLYQAIRFRTYAELKKNRTAPLFDNVTSINPLRNDFLLEDLIIKSIEKIPKRQKRVFYLRRIYNYKIREIAEMMNIKPKTVENHITLVIRYLKREFKDHQS